MQSFPRLAHCSSRVTSIHPIYLEGQLDQIADTLSNDERYRPAQFAAMLATLAEPQPKSEEIDGQDD